MKSTPYRFLSSLLCAAALTAFASQAHAGFEKLQGTYTGTYSASSNSQIYTQTFTGPTTAGVKSKNKGKLGKLTLTGSNSNIPGQTYTAKLDFKSGGKATTTALVPGVINDPADGTWKSSAGGKKVTFQFSADTTFGTFKAKGTLSGNGKSVSVKITVTGQTLSPGLPSSATYLFTGER